MPIKKNIISNDVADGTHKVDAVHELPERSTSSSSSKKARVGKALTDLSAEQVSKKQRVHGAWASSSTEPAGLDDSDCSAIEEDVEGDEAFSAPPDIVTAPAAMSAAPAACVPQPASVVESTRPLSLAEQRMHRLGRCVQQKEAAMSETTTEPNT